MPDPRLPLTVGRKLWDEMAEECGVPFADSYLSGATETHSTLTPWTVTAFQRLSRNRTAMAVIGRNKLKLVEPLPFGDPRRPENLRYPP